MAIYRAWDKTVMMTEEQLNTILELLPRNPKSGTRNVRSFSAAPVQSDTENVTMFGPKTKISKVDTTNHYSDEDSIYLDLPTNCKSSFHYMMIIVLNDKNYLTRPLWSWEKYMELIQTVSTRERLQQ